MKGPLARSIAGSFVVTLRRIILPFFPFNTLPEKAVQWAGLRAPSRIESMTIDRAVVSHRLGAPGAVSRPLASSLCRKDQVTSAFGRLPNFSEAHVSARCRLCRIERLTRS
jgi:hypothetical protein